MIKLTKSATKFELSPTLAANEMVTKFRKKGKEILHLGFGESPFPVPERLEQALKDNAHHKEYLPTAGISELRETIASYYKDKTNLDTENFDIIIAPGSKLNLYSLQMAIEGDLIMPIPSWVSYEPQAHMLGTNVIKLATIQDNNGYHIDPKTLQETIIKARSDGKNPTKLILNTPSNPTGLSIPKSNLKEIAQICIKEDIFIISDEIYGFVTFNNDYHTIAKYAPNHTAITSGLSKHLSLGGWRIGISFIPKSINGLFELLCNIASETWSSVPAPLQYAVIEAYKDHEDIEEHIKTCTNIHHLMNSYVAKKLQELDIYCPTPQGAFYTYPDFKNHRDKLNKIGIKTSEDLSHHILKTYGISTLPGTAFGATPETLTLRLAACDYKGTTALKAAKSGEKLDEYFIHNYAPNIIRAMDNFYKFLKN